MIYVKQHKMPLSLRLFLVWILSVSMGVVSSAVVSVGSSYALAPQSSLKNDRERGQVLRTMREREREATLLGEGTAEERLLRIFFQAIEDARFDALRKGVGFFEMDFMDGNVYGLRQDFTRGQVLGPVKQEISVAMRQRQVPLARFTVSATPQKYADVAQNLLRPPTGQGWQGVKFGRRTLFRGFTALATAASPRTSSLCPRGSQRGCGRGAAR